MKSSNKNKKLIALILGVASVLIIIGITYAFIDFTLAGTKRQVITAGSLQLRLEEGDGLILENALPMYD